MRAMATRRPGWEQRLEAVFTRARGAEYTLGRWDCAIFAAEAVEALTGSRPVALAGRYFNSFGMARVAREHGGSLADAVSSVLGVAPAHPRAARRGDILLRIDADGVEHLAVCAGPYGVQPAERGLSQRALGEFVRAWRIP